MQWLIAPSCGVFALGVAAYFYLWVLQQKVADVKMRTIGRAIRTSAISYLLRLYQTLGLFAGVLAIVLAVLFGVKFAVAYVFGSLCSGLAGFLGMSIAVRANSRTASAGTIGIPRAFSIAFRAGSIMGLAMTGLALMGISAVYLLTHDVRIVLAFSFGASSFALLAKAGGGIYTKTADIAADLVGKFEHSLPEDDPRNAAVIADLVGDNVGDVLGTGADIFDSYVASVVAAMILGTVLESSNYILLPLLMGGMGILASLIGVFFTNARPGDPGRALNRGSIIASVACVLLSFWAFRYLNIPVSVFYSTVAGLGAGVLTGYTSDLFTSIDGGAARKTAKASTSGSALTILTGYSYGLLSIVFPVLGICLAMAIAWFLPEASGIPGFYGVSIAACGLLSITGMVMAADAYGPIADNARGIAEIAGSGKRIIGVIDELDAVGNTAKATSKGFAIGAAALTVLALLGAYAESADVGTLDLIRPGVIIGGFLGTLMPFILSSMLILSVADNAFLMVDEVRRQFKIPGVLEGRVRPEYERCVDIAAKSALKSLAPTAAVAAIGPIILGLLLGKYTLGGFLAGGILMGMPLALFMANAGGLWDNAKKLIEAGSFGGVGSPAHRAAIIGDTVGDPLKDTAGPSLNTMLAVMSLSANIAAPLLDAISIWRL